MIHNKINRILMELHNQLYEKGNVSPDTVNMVSHSIGITDLTIEEVIYISNNY